MALPKFPSDDQSLSMLQTTWANVLNPVIANPIAQGTLLTGVALSTGANVINHMLQRKLRGWVLVRQRALTAVYDTQDSNKIPDLTLQLTASAPAVVDIYVF